MEDFVSNWVGEVVSYVVGFASAWLKVLWDKVKGWFEDNEPDVDVYTGEDTPA